jgi:cytochrome c5
MRKEALVLMCAVGSALFGVNAARAADEVDAATKAKIAQFDKGPATIDVSAYPAGIQKNYAVFREKCTLCHTLARPINSDFALPDEWSRYIKRMMHKPGSMISPGQAKRIYEFLVFDATIRKKALLDGKLAAETPAERAESESKISMLIQAYSQK